jgi:hypothetical protein
MLEILIQYEVRSERFDDYDFSISTSEMPRLRGSTDANTHNDGGYYVDVESPRRSLILSMKGLWWVLAAETCTCDTCYV